MIVNKFPAGSTGGGLGEILAVASTGDYTTSGVESLLLLDDKLYNFYYPYSWDIKNGTGPVSDSSVPGGSGTYYSTSISSTNGEYYVFKRYAKSSSYSGSLYKYSNNTFTTLSSVPVTQGQVSLVCVNGTPYIMNYYNSNTIYKYENGAFTQLSITTPFYTTATTQWLNAVEYKNKAYTQVRMTSDTACSIIAFNGSTFTTISNPPNMNASSTPIVAMTVKNNLLYAMYLTNSANYTYTISAFNGSSWTIKGTIIMGKYPANLNIKTFITNKDNDFMFLGPYVSGANDKMYTVIRLGNFYY